MKLKLKRKKTERNVRAVSRSWKKPETAPDIKEQVGSNGDKSAGGLSEFKTGEEEKKTLINAIRRNVKKQNAGLNSRRGK